MSHSRRLELHHELDLVGSPLSLRGLDGDAHDVATRWHRFLRRGIRCVGAQSRRRRRRGALPLPCRTRKPLLNLAWESVDFAIKQCLGREVDEKEPLDADVEPSQVDAW